MSIPEGVCIHFAPLQPHGCDAGRSAPGDCAGCAAYQDGTQFLGTSLGDIVRMRQWAEFRAPATPRALVRGQWGLVDGS